MITLRPYQEKIIAELRVALKKHRAALVCAPCGAGKGSLISFMVHSAVGRKKSVIFAVRGKELVRDMSQRVTRLGIEHGVLMGGQKRERWHPVQVASIDTLHRMEHRPAADLIILDEARTFLSATARKVLAEYPPTTKIVGADATPARLDGKGLGVECGGIFDVIIHGPNEQELIDMGFLVPSIPIGIPDPPDTSKIGKTGGDFNQRELAVVCDKVKLVGDIVQHWIREASGRKTVAFGVDQAHARHITEEFQKANIEWEYVDASTPDDERTAIWHRLDHGTLMGFSNVGIAGCGFDHPCISCVIAARPTASLSLWRQMIGRASRPYPGKTSWILLDHGGSLNRHHPYGYFETPPIWTLEGGIKKPPPDEPKPRPVATCKVPILVPEEGPPVTFTGPLSPDGRYMLPSYHTFPYGPSVCPYCGIPLKIEARKIEIEAGTLQDMSSERDRARLEREERSRLAKLRFLKEMKALAKTKGYQEGWARHQFENRFREPVPRDWMSLEWQAAHPVPGEDLGGLGI